MTESNNMFTEADLLGILRKVAGTSEGIDLESRDVSDLSLEELGYDSLAVMELAAHTERACGIQIPDDDLESGMSPRQIVAYVNARRGRARA